MSELRWILLGIGLVVLGVIILWGMREKLLTVFSSENKAQKRSENFDLDGSGQNLEDQLVNDIESLAISKPATEKLEPTIIQDINDVDIEDDKVINFGEPVFVKEDSLHQEELSHSKINPDPNNDVKKPEAATIDELEQQSVQSQEVEEQVNEVVEEQSQQQASQQDNQVIVLYVRCSSGKMISGKQLKESLINQGLEYGDMKIFHRMADDKNGVSTPLFGVANMVEPGTFNLEQMEQADTPGVTVFLQLPAVTGNLSAFNNMFKTSVELAESINGELVTQNKNPVTPAWLEQMRSLLAAS